MRGIILAGGEGTRLRPLTYGTPKAMVPILGRPFLEHMLVYLRGHGVTDVSLALGHNPDPIRSYFGNGEELAVRLDIAIEPRPLGSGGAIKQFEGSLGEPFFAFNGDVLTNIDLRAMMRLHRESGAALTIALLEVADPSAFGVAEITGDGRIRRFVEKPPPGTAPSNWANAGVWMFEPRVLDRIPAGRRSMVETELFPELIATGEHVQGYCERCFWVDIGTPERYLSAQLQLLERPELRVLPLTTWAGTPHLSAEKTPFHAEPPWIAASARVDGTVLLGSGVHVAGNAKIHGPVVAGGNSSVRAGAQVEGSVLWDGCHVGAGAVVRNSVLATSARVGEGAWLEGVVAGAGTVFAEGTTYRNIHMPAD